MSWSRRLIYLFWVFVITMLLWQCYLRHQAIVQQSEAMPKQQHYWFIHTNAALLPAAPAPPAAPRSGADVEQTGFAVENNVPSTGNITCRVTLKNLGSAKAVNVQVEVRPFHGGTLGDEDVGPGIKPVDDSSAVAQLSQWLTFPDLVPGESETESVTFPAQTGVHPGKNPSPQIVFESK